MEKFEHESMLKCIVTYRISLLFLVPPQVRSMFEYTVPGSFATQIVLLCKHPATRKYDLSHVEYAMV